MLPTLCPHCRSRLEVDPSCEGRLVLCGICREAFTARRDEPLAPRRRAWRDDEWDRPQRRRAGGEGAVIALVLGIVSVCLFCLWPIGMVTSGVGMALGAKALKSRSRATAVAGLVLSTVSSRSGSRR
jgi:hypothetical protein